MTNFKCFYFYALWRQAGLTKKFYMKAKYAAPFRFFLVLVCAFALGVCLISFIGIWLLGFWDFLRSKKTFVRAFCVVFWTKIWRRQKTKNYRTQSHSRQAYFYGILCSYCCDLPYSRKPCSKAGSFKVSFISISHIFYKKNHGYEGFLKFS